MMAGDSKLKAEADETPGIVSVLSLDLFPQGGIKLKRRIKIKD